MRARRGFGPSPAGAAAGSHDKITAVESYLRADDTADACGTLTGLLNEARRLAYDRWPLVS